MPKPPDFKYTTRELAGQQTLGAIREMRSYYTPPAEALPQVDWRAPAANDLPTTWRDAKRVCLDVECRDEDLKALGPGCRRDPRTNYVIGVAVAIEDGPTKYLPVAHHDGGNCDWNVREYVRDMIKDYRGTVVLNGGGYDLDWIATWTQDESILDKTIQDVQILDVLLDERHMTYNLNALCERHGLPGKDEDILRRAAAAYRCDPKTGMWRMHARFAGVYGEVDARRPLQVLRRQERLIDVEGVQQIWELEQQVTPILVRMRRAGLRIDLARLEALEQMCLIKEREHLDKVRSLSGVRIAVEDVRRSEVLAHALRAVGVEPPKTERKISEKTGKETGGKDSVDKEFLAKRAGPVGRELERARAWNNIRTNFCKQVRQALVGDRVHCTFNQLKGSNDEGEGKGVRYGRLSASEYNITGQPGRDDEFGKLFRAIYVADEGAEFFVSSDWSQQEPRIGVHYAELLRLPGAREFGDEYRRNPALDIHQKLTDLANDPVNLPRKIVKNFVNGRLYGMGDVKLCHHLGWSVESWYDQREGKWRERPTAESKAKIEQFNSFAPWISGLTREAARAAERNGFVWTWLRRKCRFDRMADGKIFKAHKAFNRVGQGSAADQMKATLVACYREGIRIQGAIHDEFIFSGTREQARRVRHLQRTHVKFSVPMKVDTSISDSWGEENNMCANDNCDGFMTKQKICGVCEAA